MAIYIEYGKDSSGNPRKLYIHGNGSRFYYLSYSSQGALEDVPEGYKVAYNKRGMPFVKKIR